ncbi:MAG: hypothetical protein JNN07_12785 [Verrucomicrobiales bacterium]|nr:hypothetical protein [Verrucomicrobiales bacterium]
MRQLWILSMVALLAAGCAGYRSQARLDAYEGVKVDELTGNKVSRGILDRRTLWLNARREVRRDQTRDYYLITELTPSPDFTLQSTGESLVLLVDGMRYGFTATNTVAPLIARPGIQTTVYRIPGDVLVKIANAEELRIRMKGTSMVLDETAPPTVSHNIKRWMLDRFSPESNSTNAPQATTQAPQPATQSASKGSQP